MYCLAIHCWHEYYLKVVNNETEVRREGVICWVVAWTKCL